MRQIQIFTPPKFERQPLDIEYLNSITNKQWIYTSNGRSSIYHILKDLDLDKILIPVYICATVLEPLKKLNIKPIFYDLDIEDLNPSLESIKKLSKKYDVKAVLVASMYGNPANLTEIEKFCKENSIFMIDDAAQSFGAKLNDRFVGTFGDAGFFSFGPGKPTAGPMGSFFWSEKNIKIKRSKHCFIHFIKWLNFYWNRYKIYQKNMTFLKRLLNKILLIIEKLSNLYNDNICSFEEEILGGILHGLLNKKFEFRTKYFNDFLTIFENSKNFKVIKSIRGKANNHKIVLLFFSKNMAKEFILFMQTNKIYASNGYKLLTNNLKELSNAQFIDKKVVELPIENSDNKMQYLFRKVKEFENRNI